MSWGQMATRPELAKPETANGAERVRPRHDRARGCLSNLEGAIPTAGRPARKLAQTPPARCRRRQRCSWPSSPPSWHSTRFARSTCPLLLIGIPWWVLLAYGHRLYHLDSHRADYRAADEIGPVLQMATLWSWTFLVALSVFKSNDIRVMRVAIFWALAVLLLMVFRSGVRVWGKRRVWYLQNASDHRADDAGHRDRSQDPAAPRVGHQCRRVYRLSKQQALPRAHHAPLRSRAGVSG